MRHPRTIGATRTNRRQPGFTLIELMVAMLLGMVVIAGVVSVFIASQRSYTTNVALSDVQDGSRIAFEMLAREIRRAGDTGCNNNGRIANVLNDAPDRGGTPDWYANWNNPVIGYEGTATDPAVAIGTSEKARVSGTDSLSILGSVDSGLSVSTTPSGNAANLKLNKATSDIGDGDIIVVCDPDHAAIAQVTNYNSSNITLVHNDGNGVATPGNCAKGLGYPTPSNCSSAHSNGYTFGANSTIAKMVATDWYIGVNPLGGRSLYRIRLQSSSSGGKPALGTVSEEMVRNVTDMQLTYHTSSATSFVDASAVTDWSTVDAVHVALTVQSTDKRAGVDNAALSRTFTSTTTIRNRVQ